MKKLMFLFLALSVFAIPSRAQSVDVSVGYSYFHLGSPLSLNQNGVSGSVAYNLKSWDWLGIVGDFGGYHASPSGVSVNTYTYLFGPRLTLRNPSKFNPFGQVLLGGSRITIGSGGGSNSQFAYSLGGGVDISLLPHLALRPQVDYVGLNTPGSHTNCTRVSAGLVVHF
jgi:outer membrane immunogenic protein